MVLRGRHLESAVFDNADLRKVDLTDAQLWGARLDSAQLQRASLESAQLQGAGLRLAQLQGASSGKAPCAIGWSLFSRASVPTHSFASCFDDGHGLFGPAM